MPVPLLRRAIRRRHSAVDEERGGHVVARHIYLSERNIHINIRIHIYGQLNHISFQLQYISIRGQYISVRAHRHHSAPLHMAQDSHFYPTSIYYTDFEGPKLAIFMKLS